MFYRTITIDQLMQLNRSQLELALRIFQKEIDGSIAYLSQDNVARSNDAALDELSNLLTLRKVFVGRLQDMADWDQRSTPEEQPSQPLLLLSGGSFLASEQYHANEQVAA